MFNRSRLTYLSRVMINVRLFSKWVDLYYFLNNIQKIITQIRQLFKFDLEK